MFDLLNVLFAFIILAILLLVSVYIKQKVQLLQQLYLPESIIAGAIALLLGGEVLGAIALKINPNSSLVSGLFPETMQQIWVQCPGVFINIVFAALFLGENIPNPQDIWRKTAPQVAFGQSLAWGQYVFGILTVTFILIPLFNIDPLAATLIEIGFEGGHGTAAGMAATLDKLGFSEGGNLALGLATVGIITGIVGGTWLIQWGQKQGYIQQENLTIKQQELVATKETESPALTIEQLGIDLLSLNFGFTAIAIALGWLILQGLFWLESVSWGKNGLEIIEAVPLFPMALIGGIILQLIMNRLGIDYLIDRQMQERIGGVAIDVVIITAIAGLDLTILRDNLGVFVSLSLIGIIWNIFAFVVIAPRIIPIHWFERGLGDMGQSMGVTATGILLIRMVDPENKTAAFESFAYKQLFFEPIVGGGLFTAAAPVLIVQFGSMPILLLTSGLLVFWLVFGVINYQKITEQ
ncbi:MAG: sodium/glutamate symporter [Xenococcus sp. MO_188.B8]|nr:sodium/glutamate symporter [Xenococcus sp. MO_188.B8]